ncbi:MAG: DUF2997 domain-containing protein [Timaviella obliquedivisa GSE-PSE-MK23-08B]|jgi:hypothetical protein|nr:DUF2997 domain-containing protein [Timaviella obliquedivisa GSE-PSE-MK23-08B]
MQIIFTIDAQGNITSEVEGGDGTNCLDATKPYEEALGDDKPKREMKAEASQLNAISLTTKTQVRL